MFLFLIPLLVGYFGYILSYYYNYKYNSNNYYKKNNSAYKLQELILIMNGECYHIHHFMSLSIIILSILLGKYIKNNYIIFSIICLLIGSSLEDFLFKDWYLIKNYCHKDILEKIFNIKKNNTNQVLRS